MFDDLDDPNPAPVGGLARAAVAARARRIRQRRVAWVAGGTALVVALAGGTVAGLREPGRDRVTQVLDQEPSPSPSQTGADEPASPSASPVESPSPSPSPTATAAPTTRPPAPSPTGSRAGQPSPEPTPEEPHWDSPDGKPGWSGGFGGCDVATALPKKGGTLPYDFLEATLELPEEIPARKPGEGAIVVANHGDVAVRFTVEGAVDTVGRNVDTGQYSAAYWSDAIPVNHVTIEPGESARIQVHVETRMCGDTSEDDRPLPAGDYLMGTQFTWSDPQTAATYEGTPQPSPSDVAVAAATPSPSGSPRPNDDRGRWGAHAGVRLT